jgi:hypothetical protein
MSAFFYKYVERGKGHHIENLITNYIGVVNEFEPVRFKRPLTTEEACEVFTHLLKRGYFRGRFHDGKVDSADYHKGLDLISFNCPQDFAAHYSATERGFENINALSLNLKDVDRVSFYEHVASLIAPDNTVSSVKEWVAQNIIPPVKPPAYAHGPGNVVVDGVELIFIGMGQCGQINRVLLYLLRFGLDQDVRVVGTPDHIFLEWKPEDGDYQILDADTVGKAVSFPSISYKDLIADFNGYSRVLDAKNGLPRYGKNISFSPSTAYVQRDKGDAWYVNYYYDLDANGEIVSTQSEKIRYHSPGRASCEINAPHFIDKESLKVTIDNCNIEGDFGIYAWILPEDTPVTFSSYEWIKNIISFGFAWIKNDSGFLTPSPFTVTLNSNLAPGKYKVLTAVTKTGLDAFSNQLFVLELK